MRKIYLLLIILVVISCQDDINVFNPDVDQSKEFLQFSSVEEMNSTLDYIMGLEDAELKLVETERGFRSFYSKSEEIYDLLRSKEFNSQEEVIEAFKKYEKYVEIIEEDGMLEATTRLSNSSLKYILNKDQIVQVEDKLLKVYDSGILTSELNNLDELIDLEEEDAKAYANKASFEFHENLILSSKKHEGTNAGYGDVDISDEIGNNNRRIKLRLEMKRNYAIGWTSVWCEHIITPQKQTFGIWWNYEAHVTAEIKYRYDYIDGSDWETDTSLYNYNNQEFDKKIVKDVIWNIETNYSTDNFHFRGYDCTATTDDIVNSADLENNKSAI